jgi:hypothetical protein
VVYRRSIIKVKKAQDFTSVLFVIVVMLTITLAMLILNKVWGDVKAPLNEGLQSAMPSDTSVNITETLDKVSSTGLLFDKLMPMIIIGLFAFVLIIAGSFLQHPIMIFIGILILGTAVIIAVIYSNLYNSISSTDEFASTKAQMGIQDKFMQYLPAIIFIMIIGIGASIMWSRRGGGGI